MDSVIKQRVDEIDDKDGSSNIPNYEQLGDFCRDALQKVLIATKHANDLMEKNEELDFINSYVSCRKFLDAKSKKILQIMALILRHQQIRNRLNHLDLEEKSEMLIDSNDALMERISIAIDEAAGKRKKQSDMLELATVNSRDFIKTSWNRKDSTLGSVRPYSLLAAKNILRPQLKFKTKIDNSADPFVPIIKDKPNSLKPLAIVLEPTENGIMYSHPYQCELDHFVPAEEFLVSASLQNAKPIDETTLLFVTQPSQVVDLLNDLKHQKEFAVDLEHHSYRSFQGITCLMQLSTREKDYLVDTLELRENLQILNEVFTDPKILKVFHGANNDIEWLQRDLGIYVVNMFDTGQAARVLNLPHFSLSYLLKLYFSHIADKQYQLADWRIRPLPEEMILYAREDTHYLLHIYDRMKKILLEKGNEQKNLLMSVFQRSKAICEMRYRKPLFREDDHKECIKKSRKVFNSRQTLAFQELFRWRDRMAREADESINYVLPNHMLLKIAEMLPREQQGILACCNPIPPLVRHALNELHALVWKARESPLEQNSMKELQIQLSHCQQQMDFDNPVYSPHDKLDLKQEDASTKCDIKIIEKKRPSAFLFDDHKNSEIKRQLWKMKEAVLQHSMEYASPYQQYCASLELSSDADIQVKEEKADDISSTQANEQLVMEKEEPLITDEIVKNENMEFELPRKVKKFKKSQTNRQAQKMKVENDVQPFDYSQVNYREVIGDVNIRKKNVQSFDDSRENTFKKTSKRKSKSSAKSLTYKKKKN